MIVDGVRAGLLRVADIDSMFDAAEALLESASAERAVVTVTAVEADALAAAIRGAEPEAIAAGAVRDALYARALVDADGIPYPAIADAVRGQVPTDAAAAAPAPGTGSDAVPATDADAAASRDAAAASLRSAASSRLADRLGLERELGNHADKDLRAAIGTWGATFGKVLTWDDLPWLKSLTSLPIVLKGICHPDDARRAIDGGADGIYVSNHGGRQANGGETCAKTWKERLVHVCFRCRR